VQRSVGGIGIGKQEFDRLKAGLSGAGEAVEERRVGKQHRQVGGELGHG
jgi:hypothetical protein